MYFLQEQLQQQFEDHWVNTIIGLFEKYDIEPRRYTYVDSVFDSTYPKYCGCAIGVMIVDKYGSAEGARQELYNLEGNADEIFSPKIGIHPSMFRGIIFGFDGNTEGEVESYAPYNENPALLLSGWRIGSRVAEHFKLDD